MKYKPVVGDKIRFTRDGNIKVGVIRWIASSGFLLMTDHDIPIKTSTGFMECDIFIEASDVIGKVE